MKFRTLPLALALAAMTAMPVFAQEMQAPVDENAPLDGSGAVEGPMETAAEMPQDQTASVPLETQQTVRAPAPAAKRSFMEKAAVAAGTLAAAYAAFEAMKAPTKKKPAAPVTE